MRHRESRHVLDMAQMGVLVKAKLYCYWVGAEDLNFWDTPHISLPPKESKTFCWRTYSTQAQRNSPPPNYERPRTAEELRSQASLGRWRVRSSKSRAVFARGADLVRPGRALLLCGEELEPRPRGGGGGERHLWFRFF